MNTSFTSRQWVLNCLRLLLLTLCLTAQFAADELEVGRPPYKPTDEALLLNSQLSVDGIRIGMSYTEVLKILGKPSRLNWSQGATEFYYFSPFKSRPIPGRSVVFLNGKVAYCEGYSLADGEQTLFEAVQNAESLLIRFGTPQTLTVLRMWFPDSGIVVPGDSNLSYSKTLRSVGIRDISLPVKWRTHESRSGPKVWSDSEPWLTGFRGRWLSSEVGLGMNESKARKLECRGQVVFDGGFVRGVLDAEHIRFEESIGWHTWFTAFELGKRKGVAPDLGIWRHPDDWEPDSNAKIDFKDERVTGLQLYVEDDQVFDALRTFSQAKR